MRRLRVTPGRIALLLTATLAGSIGTGFATTLPVSSSSLATSKQSLTKGTCTLSGTSATTDTYVNAAQPDNSFGTSPTMLVQPDAASMKVGFVQFSLAGCSLPATGGADTATLQLFVTAAASQSRTLTLVPVLSSWGNSLTWNAAQGLNSGSATTAVALGTTNNTTVTATVTVDVDALIKRPGSSFGWAIVDYGSTAGNDATTFASVNNANAARRPVLTISYEK
jgi:hypothetical protein